MFNKKEITSGILGSLEVALFMPKAIKRFKGNTASMIKSFAIPVALLPLTLAAVFYVSPNAADFNSETNLVLTGIYSLRLFIYLAAFFAFGSLIAKAMDKTEEFKSFVIANNWLSIPMAALMIAPIMLTASGAFPWENSYSLIVMITLYSFACTAFLATYIMRIPYEMAAFMAITGMLIQHNSLDFVKWAAVNTINMLV
ncbi:MAG: hypothetical protein KTR28_06925 [Micavibrio sp.]|nr:hypothetical protein [Micavibrio sp.]